MSELHVNWQKGTVTVGGVSFDEWYGSAILDIFHLPQPAAGAFAVNFMTGYVTVGGQPFNEWFWQETRKTVSTGWDTFIADLASVPVAIEASLVWAAGSGLELLDGLNALVEMIPSWGEIWSHNYSVNATVYADWGDVWATLYTAIASIWSDWGATWDDTYSATSTVMPDWGATWNTVYQATARIMPDWGGIGDKIYDVWIRFRGVNSPASAAGGTGALGTGSGLGPGGSGLPQWDNNATGTPLWRGGWTWIGERGPELVRLPRASRIYNGRDSREMARGASVVVNAQVRSDADLELLVRRVVRQVARGA